MKVICAGLPKTGTKSMAKALQILGYKVYDSFEHFAFHEEQWSEVFLQKRQPDFLSMYSDVDAVTDIPPNAFYKEILETFPDAKVILTERDNEDVWVESCIKQMDQLKQIINGPSITTLRTLSSTSKKGLKTLDLSLTFILGTSIYDKGSSFLLKKRYREYNEQVKASVPSDQLLVYNVKQGWRPLCEFLGCDIQSCPLPRENVKGSMVAEKFSLKEAFSSHLGTKMLKEIMINLSFVVLLVGIVLVMLNSIQTV